MVNIQKKLGIFFNRNRSAILQAEIMTFLNRSQSTAAETATSNILAKPYKDIPKVRGLPFIGTAFEYTSLRGFDMKYIFRRWIDLHQEYGDIYRENIVGKERVFVRAPEDTEAMYRAEGKYPIREPLPSISRVREKMGVVDMIVNLNGETWYKFRRVMNRVVLKSHNIWRYIDDQQGVCRDLVEYIRQNMDENCEVPDFSSILTRWTFEMGGTFILDARLGLLNDVIGPDMQDVIDGQRALGNFIGNTLFGFQLWRFFDTKELMAAADGQTLKMKILEKFIDKAVEVDTDGNPTIMQQIMRDSELTREDKLIVLNDLLSGAIDTTANAGSMMIYALTLNQEFQEKMRQEVLDLPPGKLTGRILDGMEYMNAFIKESTRLFPLTPGHSRVYKEDITLSGFNIPGGIPVINTSNFSQNCNPEFFPEPLSFIPERWMKSNDPEGKLPDLKFLYTGPFGIGSRGCVGRRFALQEIRLLLIEILKAYKVEYHYKPIHSIFAGTMKPSETSQYRFIPLKN